MLFRSGWVGLKIDDAEYAGRFGEHVVDNVRSPTEKGVNVLSSILEAWFGPDVGLAGARRRVVFEMEGDMIRMRPLGRTTVLHLGPELWQQCMREKIPELFGMSFNQAIWNQGMVEKDGRLILLVTLEKGAMWQLHRYDDQFMSEIGRAHV